MHKSYIFTHGCCVYYVIRGKPEGKFESRQRPLLDLRLNNNTEPMKSNPFSSGLTVTWFGLSDR